MTFADVLRGVVAGLAMMVSGSTLVVFMLYMRIWLKAPSGSGILPRHVMEVSLGTFGLVLCVGWAVHESLGDPGLNGRLWIYLVSLLLIFVGVVEVGHLQRRRAREHKKKHGRHCS